MAVIPFVLLVIHQWNFGYANEIQSLHLHDLTDGYIHSFESHNNATDKVTIKFYYECLCPYCMSFATYDFKNVVERLNEYINIDMYPYGNAKTTEHDGTYSFKCQHGPAECYGNKLHACALDIIKNQTQSALYNACLMVKGETNGSDDPTADKCGSSMNIDAEPIKSCAKGDKGIQLLKAFGDASKLANFHYVPYILVNDKESRSDDFMGDVCKAFTNPPPPCTNS